MPCRPVEFPRPIGTEFASTQLDAQLLFCVSRALLAVIEPSQKTQSHKHAQNMRVYRKVGHGPSELDPELAYQDIRRHVGNLRTNPIKR